MKVQRVKNPHSAISAATEDVIMIHGDAVCHSGLKRTEYKACEQCTFTEKLTKHTTERTAN